jgi:nitrite reductase (NADH) small subunit
MFHAKTGLAEYPEGEKVEAFPLRVEGEDLQVDIE